MEIIYREAVEADAPLLAALFAKSFTDTFGYLYAAEDLASFLGKADENSFRRELADPGLSIRLAEVEGTPVAFAKVGPLKLPVRTERGASELRQLYVLKPWQGQGIAETLMDWVLAESRRRGADELYLTVFVDNHRARRFYDRYGFEFVQPYAFMVGTHEDEDHIMRLSLSAE